MKISAGTMARTVVLAIALINQILVSMGRSILPIEDEVVTELITISFTTIASIVAWWKNNSFTQQAIFKDTMKVTTEVK